MGDDSNPHSMQDSLDACAANKYLVPASDFKNFAASYLCWCLVYSIPDLEHVQR